MEQFSANLSGFISAVIGLDMPSSAPPRLRRWQSQSRTHQAGMFQFDNPHRSGVQGYAVERRRFVAYWKALKPLKPDRVCATKLRAG